MLDPLANSASNPSPSVAANQLNIPPAWAPFNHLYNLTQLQNRYVIMRHGQSESNVRRVVVTDPAIGEVSFGLTEEGKRQADQRARAFVAASPILDSNTIVISSTFLRARQTAEIAQAVIGAQAPLLRPELRERGYGTFEGGSGIIYPAVWLKDQFDPFQTDNQVESLVALVDRTTSLVAELERNYSGRTFLLVSHGDTALALQAGFAKSNPAQFQLFGRFANAELRELVLKR